MLPNQDNFLNLIKNKKVCVMIAPSFVVDFKYPAIIGMLKKLGVSMVTELTFGAKMTNNNYFEYIKNHLDQKYYIASPCPVVVSLIKNQYPDLVKYIMPITSPMVSQAKVLKYLYSDYEIVFVSPCRAKQNIEAKEYKDCISETLSFKDLKDLFDKNNIFEEDYIDLDEKFDSISDNETRVYPISGGLSCSARIKEILKDSEILVDDGVLKVKTILEEIKNNTTKYRFFDLLNCDGGCIGGGEVINKNLSIEEKKSKIINYKDQLKTVKNNNFNSDIDDVIKNVDFSRKF